MFKKYLTSITDRVRSGLWVKNSYVTYPDEEYNDETGEYETVGEPKACLVGTVNLVCGFDGEDGTDPESYIYDLDYPADKLYDDRERLLRKIWVAICKYNPVLTRKRTTEYGYTTAEVKDIESWNDRPQTKRRDVLAVLELALSED